MPYPEDFQNRVNELLGQLAPGDQTREAAGALLDAHRAKVLVIAVAKNTWVWRQTATSDANVELLDGLEALADTEHDTPADQPKPKRKKKNQ